MSQDQLGNAKEQINSAVPVASQNNVFFLFTLIWGLGGSLTLSHLVTQGPEQGTIMPGELGSASLLPPRRKACHFCSHTIGENESHGPPYMQGN